MARLDRLKFPRETVKVGDCIAILTFRSGRNGMKLADSKPIMTGRPIAKFNGFWWRASRLSYHLNIKKITKSPKSSKIGFILHTCDNGWCINPKHLYLGTQKQNVIDLYKRHPTIKHLRSFWQKGKPKSKKHRESLSKFWKGRPKPWLRGKGNKHSAATRLKMSISQKRRWARCAS